jgi:hypothetical protein
MSNKTMVTPTIVSFVNATHSHQNAAGGGLLSGAALTPNTTAGFIFPAYPGKAVVAGIVTTVQNETTGQRFTPDKTMTFTKLTIQQVASCGASSHISFTVYDSTGTTVIATTGAQDGTVTAVRTFTLTSSTLNANTDYIMDWTTDSATPSSCTFQANEATPATVANLMNPSGGIISILKGTNTSTAGAAPSSLGTILTRATANATPYVMLSN